MAQGKKSFVLYTDLLHTVEKLPSDKAGDLFKHILKYVNDLNPETDDIIVNIAFEPIKQQLKRDLRHWEEIKIKRSESGKLGGRPKANENNEKQDEAKKPNAFLGKQTEAKKAVTENVTVTVNVNDIKKNISSDEDVSEVYKSYPAKCPIKNRSLGKGQKDKSKIKNLLKTKTKDELISTIKSYVSECISSKTFLKNFSSFLNNLPENTDLVLELPSERPGKSNQVSLNNYNPYDALR